MKIITVLVFLFIPFLSSANGPTQELAQFKIASFQLFSSFSSFMYFQGDDRNRTRLVKAQVSGDKALLALSTSTHELNDKWTQISEYTKSYQTQNSNGPDMRVEGSWNLLSGDLAQMIEDLEKEITDSNNLSEQVGIINIQVKMEMILNRYMGYATSATGGYGISDEKTPLEQEIAEVSNMLTKLVKDDEHYKPLMNQWMYIQGTLLAYNTNVAPFVVLHTFDRMRNLIASE